MAECVHCYNHAFVMLRTLCVAMNSLRRLSNWCERTLLLFSVCLILNQAAHDEKRKFVCIELNTNMERLIIVLQRHFNIKTDAYKWLGLKCELSIALQSKAIVVKSLCRWTTFLYILKLLWSLSCRSKIYSNPYKQYLDYESLVAITIGV